MPLVRILVPATGSGISGSSQSPAWACRLRFLQRRSNHGGFSGVGATPGPGTERLVSNVGAHGQWPRAHGSSAAGVTVAPSDGDAPDPSSFFRQDHRLPFFCPRPRPGVVLAQPSPPGMNWPRACFRARRQRTGFGLPGTGKTHALCALGPRLVEAGHSVLFAPAYRLSDLICLGEWTTSTSWWATGAPGRRRVSLCWASRQIWSSLRSA